MEKMDILETIDMEMQREANIAMKIGRVDYVMGYYDVIPLLGLKFDERLWTRTLKCLEIYCKTHGLDTTNEDRYEFVRIIANMPVEDIPLIRNAGTKIQREIYKARTACRKYLRDVLKERVVAVVNVLEDGSIDGYLTLPQIAKKWGVTDNYLRVMIHREKLKPAFKIGTDWYFKNDARKPIVKKGRPKKNG